MAKTAKASHNSFAQTKETLGSIIFALILALVFRGFVGQAFVIPTGSMAPTLNGAHADHICSSCGYRYAVGMDRMPTRAQCPNCNHEDQLIEQPLADAGDGIFTLSWPFAVGGSLSPQRWDVVVFKAPFRIQFLSTERDGETNYIKRLIGLPGDVLEIIDGDLYLAKAADLPEPVRAKLTHAPLPLPLTPEERKDLDARLQIAHKTPAAQESLWQILFDNDYPPTKSSLQGPSPAWKPIADPKQSKWTANGRVFRFDSSAGSPASQSADATTEPQYLELTGKDFLDNYGYNADPSRKQIVSDLRLSATVDWQGGDGTIRLCLSKYDDLYTIELQPRQGAGRTLLAKRHRQTAQTEPSALPQEQELKAWTFPVWKRNQPVRVSFANVDRRLEVRINDRIVWQQESILTAAQAKQHQYETAAPLIRIGAANCKAGFSHLLVNRDIYYQDWVDIVTLDGAGRRVNSEYSGKPGWATRDNPMLLREREYFVLGDNSPQSLDSRRWWQIGKHMANRPDGYRPGTVPADQMIGKAFFVYWPSWYRLWDIPNLRVIPNIGEMRWIQ